LTSKFKFGETIYWPHRLLGVPRLVGGVSFLFRRRRHHHHHHHHHLDFRHSDQGSQGFRTYFDFGIGL
jgi:hypothetical protein